MVRIEYKLDIMVVKLQTEVQHSIRVQLALYSAEAGVAVRDLSDLSLYMQPTRISVTHTFDISARRCFR